MSWADIPINEVCILAIDCVNKTAPVVDYETPYKMIRTTNVRNGFVDTEDCRRVTKETFEKWNRRAQPQKGDVLLAREAPLGAVGRITNDDQIFLGQRLFLYRADPQKLDACYLAYVLQSPIVQGRIISKGHGATVQHVKVGECENLLIPYPPLPIQQKIGETLSAYDDLIENNRRRIKLLEESARLLYREWFVRLQFPGHESVEVIDGVPAGWEKKSLGELADIVDYGFTASANNEEVGPKFLRITDIVPEIIDWASVPHCEIEDGRKARYLLSEGDVVVARTGATVGYAKRIWKEKFDVVYASYLIRFRFSNAIDNIIAGIFMESEEYKSYVRAHAGGAAQPNANAQILSGATLLVPTSLLQDDFRCLVEPMLEQRHILSEQNAKLTTARDHLLPRLMSGEIEV